ncbi:FimV/HubP family polar landmark protein [Wohlfahrtiimonas larvae]|uniref:LysM domain-containing protein n=2 Tax=Wohlfahrtiimonas larvae TaxID=1157986 RepID=A0ABP9N1B2_9GAMM|nr:FimV/HubP family polar landmark protein [Wohlfahrtiimonas larvae]
MIRKNILAIALLSIFGTSHAADVENLRTLSYLNEPLRLQADVVGDGEIILAAPTEYLRLNHAIPSYDLSIDVVENNGQKQVVLTTTEEIESPALTLLLESRDENNRRQLFELPIILDFKPEQAAEPEIAEVAEPEVNEDSATVAVDAPIETAPTDQVALSEVPKVTEETASVEKEPAKATEKIQPKVNNSELVKRYSVEKGETLWSIANKVRPANVTPQKMIEIIKANNPSAFTAGGVLRADVTLLIPAETQKVEHKFVASEESNSKDVRIGYIYELPEPPVQQVVESVKVAEPESAVVEDAEEVTVKVVRPVSESVAIVEPEVITIAPEAIQPVDSVEIIEPVIEPAKETETTVVTPVVESVVETVTAETAQAQQAVEPVKEEVAKPAETPKKRPVYVMPEPEPEPSIVELLFENIIYIGAGALVLILGLLAIVMRGRKKGDEQKQPKAKKEKGTKAPKEKAEKTKKKGLSLLGKKKTDAVSVDNEVTDVQHESASAVESVETKPIDKTVAAAAIATSAVTAAIVESKVEAKDETAIESLDFDLSFTGDVESTETVATQEVQEEGLDFNLSSVNTNPTEVETETSKDEESFESLDFDLSSLDTETVEAELVKIEEPMEGLDFDLSSLEIDAAVPNTDAESTNESMEGLDFDLSSLNVEPTSEPLESEDKVEEYEGLDFDLSAFSTPAADTQVDLEETFDTGTALDFDLSDFKVEEQSTEVQNNVVAAQPDSFGENNPLFAPQTDNADVIVAQHDDSSDSSEPVEYISFPDLLENAEDALVKDDIEAEKPEDFGTLLEDEEAGLANLMEASKKSEGVEPKLDLSFVADADDDAASIAFLDSLDVSDEVTLDDPISSSVKDNVAKSMETIEIPEVTLDVEALDLPTLDASTVEEVSIIEPVVEEVEVPEVTLVEPTIEEPEITIVEPIIEAAPVTPEPVIEPIVPPVVEVDEDDDIDDADFESEQVKLELAVAYMDFDKSLAKPLLDEVIKDGSPKQIAKAQALLDQINS